MHKKKLEESPHLNNLCNAFLYLKTEEGIYRFLLDLTTPAEIKALTERWRVALLLHEGKTSYRDIHADTGVSVTTIGRVARFLNTEPHQGYQMVIQRRKTIENKPPIAAAPHTLQRGVVSPEEHQKRLKDNLSLNNLCNAFLYLKTEEEVYRFLLDLTTPAELKACTERWRVALLLQDGEASYRDIHAQTGVSVTTIGRVARFLNTEPHQGYQIVLRRRHQQKKKS